METPLLINPTLTEPKNHIGFREEIPYPINDSLYGKTTIAILGLDREDLNERRREKLNTIKTLIHVIKLAEKIPYDKKLKLLAEGVQQLLNKDKLPQTEYSAMTTAILTDVFLIR